MILLLLLLLLGIPLFKPPYSFSPLPLTTKVFSVQHLLLLLAAFWMLKPVRRAPRSAHPKRKHCVPPRVQTAACFRTIKAPHREESHAARFLSRHKVSSMKEKRKEEISLPNKTHTARMKCSADTRMESLERSVGWSPGGAVWRMLSSVLSEWCSIARLLFFTTCTILMWRGGTEEEIPHARARSHTDTRVSTVGWLLGLYSTTHIHDVVVNWRGLWENIISASLSNRCTASDNSRASAGWKWPKYLMALCRN